MDDAILERAIAVLHAEPSVALPLPELAHRVGTTDPDGLARLLAADPRVVVLAPLPLPGLSLLPAERAAAFERALHEAGLRPTRRVALVHRTPVPAAGVADRLRETTARLLDGGPHADRLAEAAERANRAVMAAARPGAEAPSTTPPPGPPPPSPALRPDRPGGSRPPRDP